MRRLLLAPLAALVLALSGCPWAADPLADYDGLELITRSFADWVTDPSLSAAPAAYVNVEVAAAGDGETGDDAYRLEVLNLYEDGEFADGTVGNWTVVAAATAGISGTTEIDGYTLQVATISSPDYAQLQLRAGSVTDGFLDGGSYIVRFDYRSDDLVTFSYHNGLDDLDFWDFYGSEDGNATGASIANTVEFPPATVIIDESFPLLSPSDANGENYYLAFGTLNGDHNAFEVFVDNLRLVRSDVRPGIRLMVAADDPTLPLVSASYVFSVYVKLDGSVATVDNRNDAEAVTLTMTGGQVGSDGEFSGEGTSYLARDVFAPDPATWSDWTLLSIESQQMQIATGTDFGLELSVVAGDVVSSGGLDLDPGSLLISSPSLQLLVN